MTTSADTDAFELRGTPKRPVRFKRILIVTFAGLGAVIILLVVTLALQSPNRRSGQTQDELYAPARTTPEGLTALPGDYSEVKPPVPELGPPLPGDLGRPILNAQRRGGVRGDDKDEVALVLKARQSGVFFQMSASQNSRPGREEGMGRAGAPALAPSSGREQVLPEADIKGRVAFDLESDQNNQQRKLDFLGSRDGSGIYDPHTLETPKSPYQVMAGSVIAASMITGVNSDLPGLVVAQITENVYDTPTGQYLLIPQGSRLVGTYDSVVAFGQSRALLVWQRIVLPDGSSIEIDNLPATDEAGYAGLEDEVDYHTWRLLKGIALATLLGVGTELTFGDVLPEAGKDYDDLVRAIRESSQQHGERAGDRIVSKVLNIQPTITIRPGFPVRVVVHKDIVLRPYKGGH